MKIAADTEFSDVLNALVDRIGRRVWQARMVELKRGCGPTHAGRALSQLHALELTIERLRRPGRNAPLTKLDERICTLAGRIVELSDALTVAGRARLDTLLAEAVQGAGNLVALFHLMRTADLQRGRGFAVGFAGLDEAAPFDLLLDRDGTEAEVACEVLSAEAGRDLHRRAWSQLMDRVDPDLQSWLAAHPGRYLLKMTLPNGLRASDGRDSDQQPTAGTAPKLAELHERITRMLSERRRADHDEAAVLRLDPLMLAAAQQGDPGGTEQVLMPKLRRAFGHEAHFGVTAAETGIFVMAARAGREDEVAAAVHRRMAEIAPRRLTGSRPGILAMFIEDTDRLEWQALRAQLRLEGEARHFMTRPEARAVVAVTCASRLELLGPDEADGQPCGELRFRNPSHPDARLPALASAVLSSP
jgi:hypothetical protein